MTKARMDGLYLVSLGCIVFVLLGALIERATPVTTLDFKPVYFGARCLLEHCDPYQPASLLSVYQREDSEVLPGAITTRSMETRYNYLPTAFLITAPFALLPFGPAHILWLVCTAFAFILASFLIWHSAAVYAPVLAGVLVALALACSELFFALGNPAGIAISLCVIAVWCFLNERYIFLGSLCLALSLMLKPHDAGLIWLYFLLAGSRYRARALQTLALVVLLSIPMVWWIHSVAPHWLNEWHSILAGYSARGEVNDPGPDSLNGHSSVMITSLQTVFSLVVDEPRFYNAATCLVCGSIFLLWARKTTRLTATAQSAWLALPSVAALTLLLVYHRVYDARLLILAIPACAMLWVKRGPAAWLALALTVVQVVITSAIPWALTFRFIDHLQLPPTPQTHGFLLVFQSLPVPLILLAVAVFYLRVYWRGVPHRSADEEIATTSH